MLRDPEIIKKLTIKDFDHFMDHRSLIPEEIDQMITKTLPVLRGQKWRDMRSTLSPAFTGLKKYLKIEMSDASIFILLDASQGMGISLNFLNF
jgi:cytochrome P450 family 9